MTSIPLNLSLIREDLRKPRALSQIKAAMLAAETDYVMVVGSNDVVAVLGDLSNGVHYLPTHVATRRAYRYARPVQAHDPVLLTQFNYMGSPILHRSLVPLFPETAVEPWHTTLVRALNQGAEISLIEGEHTIIEPWPRIKRAGAYTEYRHSFDPAAVMEAVPTVLVQEINQEPVYSLKDPRAETVQVFCNGCSEQFMQSLAAPNVVVQAVSDYHHDLARASASTYVAYFRNIEESASNELLSQLQIGLEFPGVVVISPYLVLDFTPKSLWRPAFSMTGGIFPQFQSNAWMSRVRDLGPLAPSTGYSNGQAILREFP